jgi:uncharacterized lipoprotein YajG
MKKILLFSLMFLATSCEHFDRNIALNLTNDANEAIGIGKGRKVEVVIVDERKNPGILGKKEFGDQEVMINLGQDLPKFLQEKIVENLWQNGFEIAKGKTLIIYLESVKYRSEREFPIGESKFDGKLTAAIVDESGNEKFRKKYKLSLENNHFVVSSEKKDAELVNFGFRELFRDFMRDKGLLENL